MSLRLRLLLAVGAVALVAVGIADLFTYRQLRNFLYSRVDDRLEQTRFALGRFGEPFGPPSDRIGSGTFVEVRDASDNIVKQPVLFIAPGGQTYSPRLPPKIGAIAPSKEAPREPHEFFTTGSVEPGGPPFRVRVSEDAAGGHLIIAVPLGDTVATLHRLLGVELFVTVAAVVAAGLLGWGLVRRGLQPLVEVEHTAAAIAEGDLGRRVPGENDRTEVGQVARALNSMLGRIQDAFAERDATETELRLSEERMRRFVADASHELRTPIAAVSAYAELFERGAKERPKDLSRAMSGIQSETGRMGRLVQDLLLLARLDEGRPLEHKPVELVSLAAEAVDTANTVSKRWPVSLDAAAPVEIHGDRERLRQVLDNLLTNVREHTPAGTSARVGIGSVNGSALVVVADDGPGLSDEDKARVFERFFRVDPSRSRLKGGAGLGLGIVAAIVGAHGGRVTVQDTPGGGTTFTVALPITPNGDGT